MSRGERKRVRKRGTKKRVAGQMQGKRKRRKVLRVGLSHLRPECS